MKPPVLSIVGKKGSRKSQVIEDLIVFLKERELRIGLIKHLAKDNVEIDQPEKDTSRYRKRGAETVVLSGRDQFAFFSNVPSERPLEELLMLFEDYDLVLLEGYFSDALPKIEIHRKDLGGPLSDGMKNVVAVLSDGDAAEDGRYFAMEQKGALFSWIENWTKAPVTRDAERILYV